MGRGRLRLLLFTGDGMCDLALLLWPCGAVPMSGKKTMLAEKRGQSLLQQKVYRP